MRDLVGSLAGPARQTAQTAGDLSEQMRSAGEHVGGIPGIGNGLGEPFGRLSEGLGQITEQSEQQVDLVQQLALATGWMTFLLPTLLALVLWLPRRLRFVRNAAAARNLVDADADLQLFALRAMANLPIDRLARITPDPVGEWQRGNADVIRRLAALELERTGLDMPAPVRPERPAQ
ncbi:hypothetical protein ACTQ49_12305 [Luteococcus sp. Sow4_B9]|uniref:hypothetical protein n=1 Tax=Luteococcus sp. Sow4_B9 TaxID=3438792 RepID=UPI003F9D9472